MAKLTVVEYDGWKVELKGRTLTVSKCGEEREYDIPQENEGIEYDKEFPEYFEIITKKFTYHFKFEVENFFVGDKMYPNGDVVEYSSYVFGEFN